MLHEEVIPPRLQLSLADGQGDKAVPLEAPLSSPELSGLPACSPVRPASLSHLFRFSSTQGMLASVTLAGTAGRDWATLAWTRTWKSADTSCKPKSHLIFQEHSCSKKSCTRNTTLPPTVQQSTSKHQLQPTPTYFHTWETCVHGLYLKTLTRPTERDS